MVTSRLTPPDPCRWFVSPPRKTTPGNRTACFFTRQYGIRLVSSDDKVSEKSKDPAKKRFFVPFRLTVVYDPNDICGKF